RWNWRSAVKKMVDGKITISRPRNPDPLIYEGVHPAIVSEDVFNKAQEYIQQNPPRPVTEQKSVQNPLAGIVVCGVCGKNMVRRPYKNDYPDTLMCQRPGCENVSSDLKRVEDHILQALAEWLKGYKLIWEQSDFPKSIKQSDIQKKNRDNQQKELDTLHKQLSKAHDLLEQGIYDTDTFLDRSREISERINQAKENIARLDAQIKIEVAREENTENVIPKVEHLLEVYSTLPNAQAKNNMLKDVLEKVVYLKKKRARKKTDSLDDFEITLFPKIPPLP
ncbi:MAG: recombinase zinc beta ribbon domain-containing protein, partial [Ruminiclostridium sp.]|nr:recombinase zinc beta ribbon domain-containing protein [Ruminiclostridium sp.]